MDLGIAGRRAFIAGSSSGMGSEIARKLAEEGAEVIIHGRSRESADKVAQDIRAKGGTASVILGSLSDPEVVERVAGDALAIGPIDILINCHGSTQNPKPWFEKTRDDWAEEYQHVTLYALQLIKAFVPGMRERGWGRILNLSSVAAVQWLTRHADYSAAKLALHSLTTTLSRELGPCGVTCNILLSGLYQSETLIEAFQKFGAEQNVPPDAPDLIPRVLKIIGSEIIMERGGTADEFASAAAFLVSECASYITGATLRVDGGNVGTISI